MRLWKRAPWQPRSRVGLERVEIAPDPPTPYPSSGTLAPPGDGWVERVTGGNGTRVWTHAASDADDALAVWQRWREVHDSTGWWPILADWDFWAAVDRPGSAVADPAATGAEWLTRALYGGSAPLADRILRSTANWPSAGVARARSAPQNYLGATEVVLVPAAAGWLVPETLGWLGGAKLGVYGAQHTLVLRRWAGLWGAEPQGLGADELVLRVRRPPRPRDEAWLAAVELAAYCPELVRADQDSTLEDLAVTMVGGQWDIVFDLDDDDEEDEDDEDSGDESDEDADA